MVLFPLRFVKDISPFFPLLRQALVVHITKKGNWFIQNNQVMSDRREIVDKKKI